VLIFATSDKGGTGRSVTSSNVAYREALLGKDVCYLDFDFGSPRPGRGDSTWTRVTPSISPSVGAADSGRNTRLITAPARHEGPDHSGPGLMTCGRRRANGGPIT
jgi:hypothetical protein